MLAMRFEGEVERFLGNYALRERQREKEREKKEETEKIPKSAAAINLRC